jgi:hypothetical protein
VLFASTDNPVIIVLCIAALPLVAMARIMGIRWLFDWRRKPGQPLLFSRRPGRRRRR